MAKKEDPLAAWKRSVTPIPEVEKAFLRIEKFLKSLAGGAFEGQSQKFPPKYALEVSARAPLHRGKRFASAAALGRSLYFELLELDEAQKKQTKTLFKGIRWTSSDGYEITKFSDVWLRQLEDLIQSSASRFQTGAKEEQKLTPYKPKLTHKLPPEAAWTSPMSWLGSKLAPSDNFSRTIPDSAVFTRGELLFTLAKSKGIGIQSQSEATLPALLELEPQKKGQPPRVVAAHAVGFDGKAWSFRLMRQKNQWFMPLFVGDDHTKQSPANVELLKRYPIERVELQSVLCLPSGKAIRIALGSNFEIEPEDEFEDLEED